MSRGRALFKQSDVERAIRAVKKSGIAMLLEIAPDGTIRMVPIDPTQATINPPSEREIVL